MNKQRLKTRERVRKYREKNKTKVMNGDQNATGTLVTPFKNRMSKCRSLLRLKENLPKTPVKRSAVISAYLESNSPTAKSLRTEKYTSPGDVENIELANCILGDMKQAIESTKSKRSDDARSSINVLCAAINGPNSAEKKIQKKVARKLGLPVRRISSGKRIRHKIMTSEKSSWTHTCRKTRSDKITDSDREKAYNFWTSSQNSRPTGNKCDIKRIRVGPKLYSSHMVHVLEKTQTEVFLSFRETHPEIKMCQRTFERCKPYYVVPTRPKDRNTCCCRYHVETRTVFKDCMSFRKKIIENKSEAQQREYPIYNHLNEIIPTTFCQETDTDIDCINRECNNCGVHLLKLLPEECDTSETALQVTWSKYEYVNVNVKKNKEIKKLCLVKKTTAPGEMFSYLKHLLVSFPAHQFRANWQTNQMKTLIENLPMNDCICIHDFSENFSCIEKHELQSSYFQKNEVSIHVTVIHRHAILEYDGAESTEESPNIVTEHFFVISPDLTHDQYFTHAVQNLVSEHLKSIRYQTRTMHEFTDGCQAQYKSRHCMGSVAHACYDFGYECFIRNYFETSHGKGPQDAAGGCFKRQAEMAIIRGTETIQSAEHLYNFGKNKFEQPSGSANCKRRHFRYIEQVTRETQMRYKPIPRNRQIHQIIATGNPSLLFVRNISCYTCDQCITGNYGACTNRIGKTRTAEISREGGDDQASVDDNLQDNSHVNDLHDLCQPTSILAVFTDDPSEDFYLFKAKSKPEKLKRKLKDSWGATFEKGCEVIRGFYFETVNNVFTYRLLKDRLAVVPACSVRHVLVNASESNNTLTISEDDHVEILASLDSLLYV
ncbi:uncharacterized protein [Argopecten irradians]|uniref:uncharacterized protein n=1 Tax=Argopecten irradians TaxID=31199 RepID=UPI0037203640